VTVRLIVIDLLLWGFPEREEDALSIGDGKWQSSVVLVMLVSTQHVLSLTAK
jgi:hypothetical protein